VVVFSAKTVDLYSQGVIKELIKSRWQLPELEAYYQEFLDFYRPICQQVFNKLPAPAEAFLLRSALIHDFRRILLRDPDFPSAMLPQGWVGHEAHDLVKRVYKVLVGVSSQYIQQNMKNAQGTLPAPQAKFYHRFGGLNIYTQASSSGLGITL
jgi:phenylacetic acid degradation operon negative regulatory protein